MCSFVFWLSGWVAGVCCFALALLSFPVFVCACGWPNSSFACWSARVLLVLFGLGLIALLLRLTLCFAGVS